MSWQDWVPGKSLTNIPGDLANGNFSGAGRDLFVGGLGLDPVLAANQHFFVDPANKAKAGYDQAMQMNDAGSQKIQDFYSGAKQQALGYYQPMQQMFNQSYGTQGIAAPQVPKAPGVR